MTNNAYLKIILTVIAVELLVLIFKPTAPEKVYLSEATPMTRTGAVQAGYTMPNTNGQPARETIDVRIVDFEMPDRKKFPVSVVNSWELNGNPRPLKVEITK